MKKSQKTRVIIADESLKFAEALAQILRSEKYSVTGIVSNEQDLFYLLKDKEVDLLIYDFFLSENASSFSKTLKKVSRLSPKTIPMVLSLAEFEQFPALCLDKGAKIYCDKTLPIPTILNSIRNATSRKKISADA